MRKKAPKDEVRKTERNLNFNLNVRDRRARSHTHIPKINCA